MLTLGLVPRGGMSSRTCGIKKEFQMRVVFFKISRVRPGEVRPVDTAYLVTMIRAI